MQGRFTKAQKRAMQELADLIGATAGVETIASNMSWAPARWDSILHVLQRLLVLLPEVLLFLAVEASDPSSVARVWAKERLHLCTFANIVHLGLLAEAISAGSEFVHSGCKDGGTVATTASRAKEFRARLGDLFAIQEGNKVPLVFQERYDKGFLHMALRAIKETKLVKYKGGCHILGWPGDAKEICQPLGHMQNYVKLVCQGLDAEVDADAAVAFAPFDLDGWADRSDAALDATFLPLASILGTNVAELSRAYVAIRPAAQRAKAAGRAEVRDCWCHAMTTYPSFTKSFSAFARAIHALNVVFDSTAELERHFSHAQLSKAARQARVRPAIVANLLKIRVDGPSPDSLVVNGVPSVFLQACIAEYRRRFHPAPVRDRANGPRVPRRDAGVQRGHKRQRTFAKLITERKQQLSTLRADASGTAHTPLFGADAFAAVPEASMRARVDDAAKAAWSAAQATLESKILANAKKRKLAQALDAQPMGHPARRAKLAEKEKEHNAMVEACQGACVLGAAALGLPAFTAADEKVAIVIQGSPGATGERERRLANMIRTVAGTVLDRANVRVVSKLCDVFVGGSPGLIMAIGWGVSYYNVI